MTKINLVAEPWLVADLKPYARNAKKHSAEQIADLARSIKGLGWTAPIVVDKDGVIITGHGRRLAAIELGLDKVSVICRRDLSPAEVDALRLADNRIASTDYDQALIQDEIGRLYAEGFKDIELTGYSGRELEFMTTDMAVMSGAMLVDDVSVAVAAQKAENEEKAGAAEAGNTPVSEAFGFKRVTVRQSRRIKAFVTQIEGETGLKGIDALIAFIDDMVG